MSTPKDELDPKTLVMRPSERPMLPDHPENVLTAYSPPSAQLLELARLDAPDSGPESRASRAIPLPAMGPGAPEWMRAARAMSEAFERAITRGTVEPSEQAAIERAWLAWTMGGITPQQVLRVVKLVSHAHRGLLSTPPARAAAAIEDCTLLVYNGLPSAVRSSVSYERVRSVVTRLREQPAPWLALVDATAELLGWRDYAQAHAASILRAVIDDNG